MKRSFKILALATVLVAGLAAMVSAGELDNSTPGQIHSQAYGLTLGQPTRGVPFYTAAINTDGTVANCFGCNRVNTKKLATGEYQIEFFTNVQATNGWSRIVQPDTLTTGTIGVWCDTADRAGDASAVWVNCQTASGAGSVPADASFFLFVLR